MKYSILLVEDDESLNRGVSLKLSREGYTVHRAANLKEARALFDRHTVGLIICDIGLPDGSGLDFCREIRRRSKVLFLFLTARDTELDIVGGYDAGGDDYVTKPFSLMVLLSKVHVMMARISPEQSGFIRSGDICLYPVEKRVERRGKPLNLTANEYKLLHHLMRNPGHILSKAQLLDAI